MVAVELRHLRYLLAVAEHGNFTRAAESMHVSQPTLSHQIRQLERMVGAQLLDRSGRAVRLTDTGIAYAEHAGRALQDLAAAERAVHDVRDLSRGRVRLALTPTFAGYLAGPVTAAVHGQHPGIDVTVTEANQDGIEAQLLADELDLGIAFTGPHLPGITAVPLYTETLSLVTRAEGATVPPGPLPVGQLHTWHLALLSTDFATRRHISTYLADHGVTPRIAVEANSIHTLTDIVRRTTLATILPDEVAHELSGLAVTTLSPPLPAREVTLLSRTDAYPSAAMRATTQLIHDLTHTRGYRLATGA
ncbi:transcriptional regulator CynR [Amycolatopsis sp. PS_44_ISF1]|uniref:transcriptional regulator CynR n=1 Tax=Amycolatopsis sp. PS_44_ISF1 TaxID=2974917 RepID=UPI0028DD495C|nr:transcriptional regulator CynR [Amycolatopsis sp. PS_44_ISF1]MDT8913601.1 transcriptional regulator CynR [Amycolatopsis sp. PS_44_ISF1]